MKKVFLVAFLLVAVVLVGASCGGQQGVAEKLGVDKLTQVELEVPSDWQAYESDEHKFSFKYAPGWQLNPEIDKADLLTFFLVLEDESQEERENELTGAMMTPEYMIAVRVEDNPGNLSAREHELKPYPRGGEEVAKSFVDVEIAGVKGFKDSGPRTPPSSGDYTSVKLAPENGKVYSFVYSAAAHPESHEKYLDEFFKILETLEFSD